MTALEKLLASLERAGCRPRRSGAGYMAFCPLQEADRRRHKPSLSLRENADETVVLHCFGGCSPRDVVESLGPRLADRFPDAFQREWRPRVLRRSVAVATTEAKIRPDFSPLVLCHSQKGGLVVVPFRWEVARKTRQKPDRLIQQLNCEKARGARYQRDAKPEHLARLAANLGVSIKSLR
ncbi:MAG: hypothetical protein ACUVQG_05345 [Thermogutta sp.]